MNEGSSPSSGAKITAIGEMDIISVFETEGVGSIPAWPAKIIKKIVDKQYVMLYNSHILSN